MQTQEVANFGPLWPAGYNLPIFVLDWSWRELLELELREVQKGSTMLDTPSFPLGSGE